jgi:hypothetical protein
VSQAEPAEEEEAAEEAVEEEPEEEPAREIVVRCHNDKIRARINCVAIWIGYEPPSTALPCG